MMKNKVFGLLFCFLSMNLFSQITEHKVAIGDNFFKLEFNQLSTTSSYINGTSEETTAGFIVPKPVNIMAPKPLRIMAPNFELTTPEGQKIKLSDLRGQYVLIHFWASWSGPCRRENPTFVALYNKFHSKGLEILSVSLDGDEDSWKNAIAKDGLVWKHCSDLKKWDSSVISLYNIQAITTTVLVDKKGRIIASGLRGASLETKLHEVLK
jgi:peroxiredoxin